MSIEITTDSGEAFELTKDEERFYKAVLRLEKLKQGRISLFGSGSLSMRMGIPWVKNQFYTTSVFCEGGDGGDNEG